jgi:hypothetical protein
VKGKLEVHMSDANTARQSQLKNVLVPTRAENTSKHSEKYNTVRQRQLKNELKIHKNLQTFGKKHFRKFSQVQSWYSKVQSCCQRDPFTTK